MISSCLLFGSTPATPKLSSLPIYPSEYSPVPAKAMSLLHCTTIDTFTSSQLRPCRISTAPQLTRIRFRGISEGEIGHAHYISKIEIATGERTKGDKSLKSLSHLTTEMAEVARGGERRVVEGGPSQDLHHAREWSFFLSAPSQGLLNGDKWVL